MWRQQVFDAFTTKYNQYSSMIYRLSLVCLKNPEDCEDILQEIYFGERP